MQRFASSILALFLVALPSIASAQEDLPQLPASENSPAVTPPPPPPREETPPQQPQEEKYVPHGFTAEVGLGLAFLTSSSHEPMRDHSNIGLAPLQLSLGGWVSPKVALMFRMAGTSYFRQTADDLYTVDKYGVPQKSGGKTYQIGSDFYGGVVQYWPSERFFVSGGVGLALFGTNPLQDIPKEYQFTETGLGFDARAGWVFAVGGKQHAFGLVAEVIPTFTSKTTAIGSALNLQWQFL